MALTDNLESAWELNEASGNALDSHGSNELTDTNTVGSGTGLVYGAARDLEDGSTEYFTHSDNASLSLGDIDFTAEMWVNLESKGAYRTLASKWGSGSQEWMCFFNPDDNRFQWWCTHDGVTLSSLLSASSFGAPSVATWYQVIIHHDATANQMGIAVNDGTINTQSHTTGIYNGTADFRIGSNQKDGQYWDGLIGPVRFWKRVLTTQERTDLYNSGAGLAYSAFGGGGGPSAGAKRRRRLLCARAA